MYDRLSLTVHASDTCTACFGSTSNQFIFLSLPCMGMVAVCWDLTIGSWPIRSIFVGSMSVRCDLWLTNDAAVSLESEVPMYC